MGRTVPISGSSLTLPKRGRDDSNWYERKEKSWFLIPDSWLLLIPHTKTWNSKQNIETSWVTQPNITPLETFLPLLYHSSSSTLFTLHSASLESFHLPTPNQLCRVRETNTINIEPVIANLRAKKGSQQGKASWTRNQHTRFKEPAERPERVACIGCYSLRHWSSFTHNQHTIPPP